MPQGVHASMLWTGLNRAWAPQLARLWIHAHRARGKAHRYQARFSATARVAGLVLLVAASAYLAPAMQRILETRIATEETVQSVQGVILNTGNALIGAAVIVVSLVLFAVQVNIERMPHGLFRRLSEDRKLLGAFVSAFALAVDRDVVRGGNGRARAWLRRDCPGIRRHPAVMGLQGRQIHHRLSVLERALCGCAALVRAPSTYAATWRNRGHALSRRVVGARPRGLENHPVAQRDTESPRRAPREASGMQPFGTREPGLTARTMSRAWSQAYRTGMRWSVLRNRLYEAQVERGREVRAKRNGHHEFDAATAV